MSSDPSQKSLQLPLYRLFQVSFGHQVRKTRTDLAKTQDWLALQIGVSRQTIMSIEKGQSCPSFYVAFCIIHTLGMHPGAMLDVLSNPHDYAAEEEKV